MASIGLKVIRTAFAVGERVAPRMTGRAGFVLFSLTPGQRGLTTREREAAARAAPFMNTARHHRLKISSGCVAVHEFRPDAVESRGSVLVLHGWRSRTEYMRSLVEGFRDAGYRVYAIDFPGHGASPGRRLTMATAVEAVAQAAQWFGPFAAVVGHSFGGAVAVNAVAGSLPAFAPIAAGRLVIISAPDSISEVLDGFGRQINLGRRSRQAIGDRIQQITGRPVDAFNGSTLLASVDIPTLVIHAPDDREVPARDAQSYATAGGHVSLQWAEGLGHRRILSDPETIGSAVAFTEGSAGAREQARA